MRESGYYPMGAENDPRAPWNEVEQEEVKRECLACFDVRRRLDVATSDYTQYGLDDVDTSDVDWASEYADRHYDPVELISALKDVVRRWCADAIPSREKRRISRLLREAEGWELESMSVEEEV